MRKKKNLIQDIRRVTKKIYNRFGKEKKSYEREKRLVYVSSDRADLFEELCVTNLREEMPVRW
jgi:hypothetical protein